MSDRTTAAWQRRAGVLWQGMTRATTLSTLPLPAATLPLVALALLLGGCASAGQYPSLARRDAERVAASAMPVAAASPAPAAPRVASEGLAGKLSALVAQARGADSRFAARRSRAETLVGAARGAAIASEAWSVATVAVSELESARSEAMIAMADLDAMNAADRIANPNEPSADAPAIAAARDTVSAIIAGEDAVLAALKGRLAS